MANKQHLRTVLNRHRLGWVGLSLCAIAITLISACSRQATAPNSPKPLSSKSTKHYLRGKVAWYRGDTATSVRELQKAHANSPNEIPIHMALVQALHNAGDTNEAIREIRKAQHRWPKSPLAWAGAAELQQFQHHWQQAEQAWARAIALGETTEHAYLSYANILMLRQRPHLASKAYNRALIANPESSEARYQLARIDFDALAFASAIKRLDALVLLWPQSYKAWALLAVCHYRQGDTKAGDTTLVTPFDRANGNVYVANQIFEHFLDLETEPEHPLAKRLSHVFDRNDLPADTRISLAHWQLQLGNFSQALAWSRQFPTTALSEGSIAELQARALLGLRQNTKAKQILAQVPQSSLNYPFIRSLLAHILSNEKHHHESRTILRNALHLHPDNADLVLMQALVEENAGDVRKARTLLLQTIEEHPRATRPRYALSQLETRHGTIANAAQALAPLLQWNPSDVGALNTIGYTLIRAPNQRSKSQRYLLRALSQAPDQAFVLDSYGWFLFYTGHVSRASLYLERAVRLSPAEAEVLWHLAEVRLAQGKTKQSMHLFARAEQFAISPRLRYKIQTRRQFLAAQP